MAAKTQIFFRDADARGWSETYYYNGTSSDATVQADLTTLIGARAAILTNSVTITHARMASGTKRDPRIFALNGGAGFSGGELPPTLPADVALLVRMNGNAGGYMRPFIRGCPGRVVQAESYVPDATFTANMNTYTATVTNGKWLVRDTMGGDPTQFVVTALTPNAPRGYNFARPAGSTLSLAQGDVINMHGTSVPGYKGLKTVTRADNTLGLYTVGGSSPPVADTAARPYVTKQTVSFTPITLAFVEGVSNRKTGRPFGPSRGRAPTLYSLRQ